jgi:tetratricopeptide (TPR) repeat protein
MKFEFLPLLSLQDIRMVLPLLFIILAVFGIIPSSVSAESEYTQGWLGAPDWVLDRIDKSILPDLFIPKIQTGESEEIHTVSSYVQDGNDLLASGSFDAAKRSFEGAIGLNSRSFDAWLGKGYALEGLKRYQSALESYEKAIDLSKNKVLAWAAYAGKGRTSFELQQYQVAGDAISKSIDMFDRSKSGTTEDLINLYLGLAKAKEKLGEEADASYAHKMADELKTEYNINSS